MSETQLKPCPWCRKTILKVESQEMATDEYVGWVSCQNDKCQMSWPQDAGYVYDTRAEAEQVAVTAWNDRPATDDMDLGQPADVIANIVKLLHAGKAWAHEQDAAATAIERLMAARPTATTDDVIRAADDWASARGTAGWLNGAGRHDEAALAYDSSYVARAAFLATLARATGGV